MRHQNDLTRYYPEDFALRIADCGIRDLAIYNPLRPIPFKQLLSAKEKWHIQYVPMMEMSRFITPQQDGRIGFMSLISPNIFLIGNGSFHGVTYDGEWNIQVWAGGDITPDMRVFA